MTVPATKAYAAGLIGVGAAVAALWAGFVGQLVLSAVLILLTLPWVLLFIHYRDQALDQMREWPTTGD